MIANEQGLITSKELRNLPPQRLQRLLDSDLGTQAIPPELRRRAIAELSALRHGLLRRTCSQSWFASCWESGEQYPPRADSTAMVPCSCERCATFGTLWPAHYVNRHPVAGGPATAAISYECYLESLSDWQAAHVPSSPSGLALRAIREGRIKVRRQRTHVGTSRRRVI